MDYTAVGDTTNLAARLQAAGGAGPDRHRRGYPQAGGGYFVTRPLGALAIKGKAEPVNAWEVVRLAWPAPGSRWARNGGSRRLWAGSASWHLLLECFGQARAGHGQVVFVMGEAGIGKSRLLLEFRRRLGDEVTWLKGACMSFGEEMAYHPLIDFLKHNFQDRGGGRRGDDHRQD